MLVTALRKTSFTPLLLQPTRPPRQVAARASGLRSMPGGVRLTSLDVFALTALAKMGSTLVTYPLLLIKSRLQV